MDPKDEGGEEGWSAADIASMLTGRDDARQSATPFYSGGQVELAPGFQHDAGEYVVDPDYADIMGIDYDELVQAKSKLSRG